MTCSHDSWFTAVRLAGLVLGAACLSWSTAHATEPPVTGATFDIDASVVYPVSPMVVNVKQAPYHARGDGITDDTQAIQQALFDVMGQHKMLYFPQGTYLVSKTLQWSKKNSAGKDAWGKNFLQGQNVERTIIRLKDGVFPDPRQPASIMWCGGFGSADWFHNYVQDLTFDVGNRNPGAIGLQFYSNNSGAVRNCRFIAGEDSGLIGLDLGHRDMNGPLLVRNCEVVGFQRGISTSRAVNGQIFEHITLRGQTQFGFTNEGQAISLRGLVSDNAVPAIQTYGTFCLVAARLTGREGADKMPAIVNFNGGRIYLRDIVTHNLRLNQQRVWARQLNVENEGSHIVNDRSDLWVLGYKTERGGTLLETRGGGRSEILGGFSYTTTAGKLAPMFVTDNSSVFAFFGEVCYNGDPFETLIRETRDSQTKLIRRGEGSTVPYSSRAPQPTRR